jgi:putative ABC transport system ATP-binding protein
MPAAIELRGVRRTYASAGRRVDALLPVDLVVGNGDYLAATGPSGSGKSTLLHLLGLLDRPTAGEVQVDGRATMALGDAAISALRGATLGFVFQSFHLLPQMTVLENVELPLVYARTPVRARRAMALAALARVGLAERAYSLPPELSGGQRQRVAIARAVVRQPVALICDEPTGNLDAAVSQRVTRLLREVNDEGVTVVVATHDPSVAGEARRLLAIHDGAVREIDAAATTEG